MVYGAIDLHARKCQIRVVDADGHVLRERRVSTTAEDLVGVFQGLGPVRVLVESGTESEWVAQALETAGYEVIVADPNHAPMYGERTRKVKTDRRDAAALAEANRRGWYRRAYRRSAAQRLMQHRLRARRQLVAARSGVICVMRAILRHHGLRLGNSARATLSRRLAALVLPPGLAEMLAPLHRVVDQLTREVAELEAQCTAAADGDSVVAQLQTVPGVGPIVALTFRAFVDDVSRFAHASQVSAALGLVPREDSSAERRHRGHITKAGPPELRSLLVQAAWAHRLSKASGTLRAWVDGLAARRGRRIAIVGLARRLSRILYAIWRDGTVFNAATLAA
ncbi:MAG TPA: IS110 family transposase [Steroidobacteraceae bacterium]|jgi:transposase|nr:IS110 family transposase [Steroidobacteraceae bacterium]